MKIFVGFEELVHHIAFVDVLQQGTFLYHSVQVSICYEVAKCANIMTATVASTTVSTANLPQWQAFLFAYL